MTSVRTMTADDFNPPAPRGAGRDQTDQVRLSGEFQSTRSSRSGTRYFQICPHRIRISIHPLLAERDRKSLMS